VAFTAYIVECSVCQQAWEVPTEMLAEPGHHIQVPDHLKLSWTTGRATSAHCEGNTATGFGYGERGHWEYHWPLRHVGRAQPQVLNGAGVGWV
jgi:hypothetical protein